MKPRMQKMYTMLQVCTQVLGELGFRYKLRQGEKGQVQDAHGEPLDQVHQRPGAGHPGEGSTGQDGEDDEEEFQGEE